jgi:methyl-accepting chemotaxis protein
MRLSLRNRFLIPVVALIILGMGIASAILLAQSRQAVRDLTSRQLAKEAGAAAMAYSGWIADRQRDINNWSRQNAMEKAVDADAGGTAVREMVNEILVKIKADYPFFEWLGLADAGGEIVSASKPERVGELKVDAEDFFKEAFAGRPAISAVRKSRDGANPVFVLAAPVSSYNTIAGVLFGVIDLQALNSQYLDPIKNGASGYAYLYARNGLILGHPDPANILSLDMNQFDFGRQMMASGKGLIVYTFKGVEKIAAYEPVAATGWTAAVSAATGELYAPLDRMAFLSLGVCIAMIGLSIGVILFVVRRVVAPVYRIVANLDDAAAHVAEGSGEVSASSQQLAEGAGRQAAAIEETSSSLEEMASMTRQNAENARQAQGMMAESGRLVEDVDRKMAEMVAAIGEITASSEQTGKIIKTIDEIAFQTNLLALNAAVEAARAGEAGAGFAVVADEVRNLAMRAADAARNTSQLIENTIRSVQNGGDLTRATQKAFVQNLEITRKVGELVQEISAASGEQSQGVDQISAAVSEMDKVVQQVAASAEESAGTAEELSSQSREMNRIVAELQELMSGGRGRKTAAGKRRGEGRPLAPKPARAAGRPIARKASANPGAGPRPAAAGAAAQRPAADWGAADASLEEF